MNFVAEKLVNNKVRKKKFLSNLNEKKKRNKNANYFL